jgi:AcrR family transcriptional regulator
VLSQAASRQRRDLSLDEIIDRAALILRDEGDQALTMRRIAAECGVTPMAIYHHVTDKETLTGLVMDRLIDAALVPRSAGDWRTDMIEFASRYRRVFIDNPGAGRLYVRQPVIGPGTARAVEEVFRILATAGFPPTAIGRAADAIVLLIYGSLVNDLTRPANIRDQLIDVIPRSETPHMKRSLKVFSHREPEQRFRDALAWLLNGLEHTLMHDRR